MQFIILLSCRSTYFLNDFFSKKPSSKHHRLAVSNQKFCVFNNVAMKPAGTKDPAVTSVEVFGFLAWISSAVAYGEFHSTFKATSR